MKVKKLLTLAVVLLCAGNSWAQFTEGGKYYLYNEAAQKWLGAGNNAGTQASFIDNPEYVVFHLDGAYRMESQFSNWGNYWFDGAYMDGGESNAVRLTIKPEEGGGYTIANGESLFGYDDTNATILGTNVSQNNAIWQIYSEAEMHARLKTATGNSPIDATWLILDPNFGRNNRNQDEWDLTDGKKPDGWSAHDLCGGDDTNRCAEVYHKGFTLAQSLTNVPNGTYSLTAQGFYRNDGAATTDLPYFYINDGKGTFKEMSGTENNMEDASASFSAGLYTIDPITVTVTNNTITLGAKLENNTNLWCIFDNFQLTYYGITDVQTGKAELNKLINKANILKNTENAVAPSVLAKLSAYIAIATSSVDGNDLDAITDAIKTLEQLIAEVETSIASYEIIAKGEVPTDAIDGWSSTNANVLHVNTWSTESDGTGMVTPFIENWIDRAFVLGQGTVSYTLAGLEPGEVYYAQALVRAYSEAGNEPNGPDFFINDVTSKMSDAGQPFEYDGMKGYYGTLGTQTTVGEDGKITLGVQIASGANYNWVAFKNVSIVSMSDALAAAVVKAKELEGKVPTAVYTKVKAVLDANTEANATSIQAITAAVEEATPFVQPYAKFNENKAYANELLEADYRDVVEGAHATYETAFNAVVADVENQTTVEGVKTVLQTLKTAGITYNNNAEPTNAEKPFNLTFLFENPDLTGLTGTPAGWYTDQPNGNSGIVTNPEMASVDGKYTTAFEYWSDPAKDNDEFTLYQKVTLPAGTYDMSCYAFAKDQYKEENKIGVYFYANDTQGSAVTSDRLTAQTLSFVQSKEDVVSVGLKALKGNTYNWMGIGYVKLYRVPAKTYEVDENEKVENVDGAGTVTLKRTIKEGYNTLVLPFSMTQAEVEEHFGEGAVVYEVTKYENDNISFSSRESIAPNTPCILKATKAGTVYEIEARTLVAADALEQNGTDAKLVGTYEPDYTVEEDDANYIISNNGLYLVNSAVTLKSTRAYIHLTEAEPAEVAARLTMTFDGGEATGIEALEEAGVEILSGAIYNVQGQRLNSLQKGINIVGGKKILVK